MLVTRRSLISGKINQMDLPLTEKELKKWQTGLQNAPLIQDAFPHLTPSQREFLLTGSTDEEWDQLFGPQKP